MAYVITEATKEISDGRTDIFREQIAVPDKDDPKGYKVKPGYTVLRRTCKSDEAEVTAKAEEMRAIPLKYREIKNGLIVEASQARQLEIDNDTANAQIVKQAAADKEYKIQQEIRAMAIKSLQDKGEL